MGKSWQREKNIICKQKLNTYPDNKRKPFLEKKFNADCLNKLLQAYV